MASCFPGIGDDSGLVSRAGFRGVAGARCVNFLATPIRSFRTYPHDRRAFTQGLQYLDGFLYEGTGLNGQSSIRKVKLETGEVLQKRALAIEHFGEGIVIRNRSSFSSPGNRTRLHLRPENVRTQGDIRVFRRRLGPDPGHPHLIMSDGTDALRFLEPSTFKERRRLRVTALGRPLKSLNELEFVNGEVFANVWMEDTGKVAGFPPNQSPSADIIAGRSSQFACAHAQTTTCADTSARSLHDTYIPISHGLSFAILA